MCALGGLIFRVDRERQRFDGRQVQVGHLRHVTPLVVDAAQINLVGVVGEIERRGEQQRNPDARVLERPRGAERDARADEVARRAPEEVLLPAVRIGWLVDRPIAMAMSRVLQTKYASAAPSSGRATSAAVCQESRGARPARDRRTRRPAP